MLSHYCFTIQLCLYNQVKSIFIYIAQCHKTQFASRGIQYILRPPIWIRKKPSCHFYFIVNWISSQNKTSEDITLHSEKLRWRLFTIFWHFVDHGLGLIFKKATVTWSKKPNMYTLIPFHWNHSCVLTLTKGLLLSKLNHMQDSGRAPWSPVSNPAFCTPTFHPKCLPMTSKQYNKITPSLPSHPT